MTVSFQVGDREFGGAGNLEVDFWVRVPSSCSSQIGPGTRKPICWMRTTIHVFIVIHQD